jgi:hypothetical protein
MGRARFAIEAVLGGGIYKPLTCRRFMQINAYLGTYVL